MQIALTNAEQWQDLKELRLASIKESPDAFGLSLEQVSGYSDAHWQILASGNDKVSFFIAYEQGKPAGLVGGSLIDQQYELVALWIEPKFRGYSVASMLVTAVKNHASKLGYTTICLTVSKSNIAACKLYGKCGFAVAEKASDHDKALQHMRWIKPDNQS